MKFRVEDIPEGGREETFTQDENWLDDRLTGERERSFHFVGPINVRLVLSRSGKIVTVKSRIEARVDWVCARCLEPFSRILKSEYTISLKPRPDSLPPEEVELRREDLETEFYVGEEVHLSPSVQDQVLLAIPQKALCREECRGLCPKCGKNLNREACHCQNEAVDPRLEPLKNFRVN